VVAIVTIFRTYAVPMSGHDEEKRYAVVAEMRRKWTADERQQIVAETEAASVSSVARKHGLAVSLVFRWRREAGLPGKRSASRAAAGFVPVRLPTLSPSPVVPVHGIDRGSIEIELAGGRKLRVTGSVEADTLRQVIAVLEGR
jgi:transposase